MRDDLSSFTKLVNIAKLRSKLAEMLRWVTKGHVLEIQKRNVPIAKLIPAPATKANKTKLGCGKNTVKIRGKLTDPFLPETDWNMLKP